MKVSIVLITRHYYDSNYHSLANPYISLAYAKISKKPQRPTRLTRCATSIHLLPTTDLLYFTVQQDLPVTDTALH